MLRISFITPVHSVRKFFSCFEFLDEVCVVGVTDRVFFFLQLYKTVSLILPIKVADSFMLGASLFQDSM